MHLRRNPFVSLQAGLAFNTFPLMEGRVIPEGYMSLRPLYRNCFESVRD